MRSENSVHPLTTLPRAVHSYQTQTEALKTAARSFNDETLTGVFYSNMRTVRDGEGNLRELTDSEDEFIRIVRAEMRLRHLV